MRIEQKRGLFAANPKPLNERTFRVPSADLAAKPAYKSGIRRKKRQSGTENLSERTLGGVATVFHSATPPIHNCSAHSTSKKTGACNMHAPLNRQPLLQKTPLPRCRLQPQPHPAKDSGDRGNAPAARPSDRPRNGQSALSSWHLCPAPSVSTPTGRDCLAATPPRLARGFHHAQPRLLLRPHSQSSAFDTYPTKGTHRRPSRRLKSFLR